MSAANQSGGCGFESRRALSFYLLSLYFSLLNKVSQGVAYLLMMRKKIKGFITEVRRFLHVIPEYHHSIPMNKYSGNVLTHKIVPIK